MIESSQCLSARAGLNFLLCSARAGWIKLLALPQLEKPLDLILSDLGVRRGSNAIVWCNINVAHAAISAAATTTALCL